jgi:predicted nucleotidyltransferase component of viral defense system
MIHGYPQTLADLSDWARASGAPLGEARIRFAQYGVLFAVASVRPLTEGLVFKGGNALDFVWQPNRSTLDLDFSIDPMSELSNLHPDTMSRLLAQGLSVATTRLGTAYAIHRVRPNPRGSDKSFVTYETRIGYALADEDRLRQRMAHGETSSNVVDLDMSLNEPICDARLVPLGPSL